MATLRDPQHLSERQVAKLLAKELTATALPSELEGFTGARRDAAADFVAPLLLERAPDHPAIKLESVTEDGQRVMRMAIVNRDKPFLVDSVAGAIAAHGLDIHRVLHPVLPVSRDGGGHLVALGKAAESVGGTDESIIYLEIARADARARRALTSEIESVLADVRAAVTDWPVMQAAMRADAEAFEEEDAEGAAFITWLLERHFTLLGHEVRSRGGKASDQLGLSRKATPPMLADISLASAFAWFDAGNAGPLILKSNRIATVHRRTPLDLIIVPRRDAGKTVALSIHAGLWTSAALAARASAIPLLRMRLADLQHRLGFEPGGHNAKALEHTLTSLPHDLVVAFTPEALEHVALSAMSLVDRPRPKLVQVPSPLGRHLYVFAWLPRDELSTGRRVAIGEMLREAANGEVLNWSLALEEGGICLIRYTIDLREGSLPDEAALDARLERMVRGWGPALEAALTESIEAGRAARLTLRYGTAFPVPYRQFYGPEEAALDVVRLNALEDGSARGARLYARAEDGPARLRLKIYGTGGSIPLSDAVPALENFAFRVIEERATPLDGGALGHIHDFLLEAPGGNAAALIARAKVVEPAIANVIAGVTENDPFNALVTAAGLDPRGANLLRAWFRYLRQTGQSYGMVTVVEALRRAPAIAAAIVGLFDAMHDPARTAKSDADAEAARKTIERGLDDVSAIDDDRILRLLTALVEATLRTNAFSPASREALAFKIDSARVPGLPAPLPWREIFVYSARVEGIHLRAGPVARGGLRWSDRRDDYRTEILGLMKAQRVKNAVIVPTGAKGGFFPKALPDPANREAWLAEGTESYRIFIRALLSVTDNIVKGAVKHPDKVVIRDGDDPYFVVAADKGTASFSDVANAIALERGFWLGDAFASGGSQGYDHKAMGITARGAWISVQRHFREMGTDVQTQPITVAGCGDMSSDVFGNGMLLSKTLRLVAAFDHRHIFLDPNPNNPEASWAERERMFALPRSSWADYDAKLISKGGGVFPRTAKTIKLSKEVKALLGIDAKEIDPGSLITAILKAKVDLLWFGGIGTYVKAASQNNAEVGDPANDRLRVNAEEVRAKAIGEGANLGVTQAGRIAFAEHGGRINTDFIDNSAGVDCSDNEVNIKIALNREMIEGRLTQAKRDALLVRMTDDVSELVLEDNRMQTLGLSIAEAAGAAALPSHVRLIETFEATGRLDRAVEGLAPNDELLRRSQDGHGLTRPELAVLLSTAKLALQDAIEASALPDDPMLLDDLAAAFPPEMRKKWRAAIESHQLRREILATKIANRIINRLGLIHPFELAEEEGASLGDIASMFVTAERLFDMRGLWDAIDDADVDEPARLTLFDFSSLALRSHIADLLRTAAAGQQPGELIALLDPGVSRLDASVDKLLLAEGKSQARALGQRLMRTGAPKRIVERVIRLFELDGAVGLAALAARKGVKEDVLTGAFTRVGEALGLDWAQANAIRMTPVDPWERLLTSSLARDFQQMRLDFLARGEGDPQEQVEAWLAAQAARVAQFRGVVDRARQSAAPNASMLAQIAGQARVLLGR